MPNVTATAFVESFVLLQDEGLWTKVTCDLKAFGAGSGPINAHEDCASVFRYVQLGSPRNELVGGEGAWGRDDARRRRLSICSTWRVGDWKPFHAQHGDKFGLQLSETACWSPCVGTLIGRARSICCVWTRGSNVYL
jgi:hypothetical protein